MPKFAFFFETGITLEIQAKNLSKNISIFTFSLLPFAFSLGVLAPPTPMLGLGCEVFQSLRMLPDIMSGKCDPYQIILVCWAGFVMSIVALI
ncbi:hypothetical protein [Microcoleus sp. BROC3]|uniref:hypothetical protein n=1 Tax=Microcoleus sp. BROC3 TaxID=3055323 RepID=UPI002FD27366